MSAYSEEWEDGTLYDIATRLVQIASHIFRTLNKNEPILVTDIILDKSLLVQFVVFNINKECNQALRVSDNFKKRTKG